MTRSLAIRLSLRKEILSTSSTAMVLPHESSRVKRSTVLLTVAKVVTFLVITVPSLSRTQIAFHGPMGVDPIVSTSPVLSTSSSKDPELSAEAGTRSL